MQNQRYIPENIKLAIAIVGNAIKRITEQKQSQSPTPRAFLFPPKD